MRVRVPHPPPTCNKGEYQMANVQAQEEVRVSFEESLRELLAEFDADMTVDEGQVLIAFNKGALDYMRFNSADATGVEGEE